MSAGGTAKKAGSGLLNAASWIVTNAHNGPREARVKEIGEEIKKLEEERERLLKELIPRD